MHVPKEQRPKLDSKTHPCVFVGYDDEEYGFRLYEPEKKKVVRSSDVVFFEHEMGAELLSTRYTSTSEFLFDATDVSTSTTPVDQPANKNVDVMPDDVGEVQPDGGDVPVHDYGDVSDHSESSSDDHEEEIHDEEVHEQGQGEQPTYPSSGGYTCSKDNQRA